MNDPVEISLFYDVADGECHHCRRMFEISAHAVFVDDEWTCPPCAGLISPGMEDIVRGLDLIYDGVTLDLFTRPFLPANLAEVTKSLRGLADLLDDIDHARVKLQVSVELVDSLVPGEEGELIGIAINRRIVAPTTKELHS